MRYQVNSKFRSRRLNNSMRDPNGLDVLTSIRWLLCWQPYSYPKLPQCTFYVYTPIILKMFYLLVSWLEFTVVSEVVTFHFHVKHFSFHEVFLIWSARNQRLGQKPQNLLAKSIQLILDLSLVPFNKGQIRVIFGDTFLVFFFFLDVGEGAPCGSSRGDWVLVTDREQVPLLIR